VSVDFARKLSARTAPLLVAVVAVVTTSAPTAYYVVRVGELRAQAQQSAEELALRLAREAARRPVLWRYDSAKIAAATQLDHPLARTLVRDADGSEVLSLGQPSGPLVWASRPIPTGGAVWVAQSLAGARRTAGLLLAPFLFIGVALAFALGWLPRRAMFRAEAHIDALVRDLQELNDTLESQVQQRLADLERAYARLAQSEERLRTLSGRALALQESERRTIARDLHDGAGQTLTAVRLQLQLLGEDPRVGRALALVDQAIEEVRAALDRLAPAVLDEVGLVPALTRLCETVSETSGLAVTFDRDPSDELPETDAATEAALYRIAQESLHNTVRHAQARRARVALEHRGGALVLEVEDDGRGFDSTLAPGRGLRGMEERASLLGGRWTLRSKPGRGTRVRVELPR